jgi:DNA-binding Xre family transcriptional regulator
MFTLCIDKVLRAKGIAKPYTWLSKNGINHHTAYKILHKPTLRVPIQVLHTICEAAWCTPSDLFEWIPDNPIKDIPNHPLQALKPKEVHDLIPDLQKLTPQQLLEIEHEIKNKLLGEGGH